MSLLIVDLVLCIYNVGGVQEKRNVCLGVQLVQFSVEQIVLIGTMHIVHKTLAQFTKVVVHALLIQCVVGVQQLLHVLKEVQADLG